MRALRILRSTAIAVILFFILRQVVITARRAAFAAGSATSVGSTLPRVAARPFSFRVPKAIDPHKRYPLIVGLHGLGGQGAGFARYFRLDVLVDELGFLAAFPDGTMESSPHARRFWNALDTCCDFYGSGVDDVAYLDDVIADMSARFPVDEKRVYLIGHSNGGCMSYRYACDRAARVAAIVSSAGSMWSDVSKCRPSEPVAVLELHGTRDEVVPYAGDRPDIRFTSAHESVLDWARLDGCAEAVDRSAAPMRLVVGPSLASGAETTVERWGGCRGVELWTMKDSVHSPDFLQPDLARALGAWLLAHPKP